MPVIETPVGPMSYSLNWEGKLAKLWFGVHDLPDPAAPELERQIEEYFQGTRSSFDFPLAPIGTPFQLAVWNELMRIPKGDTKSYLQIARALGDPKATRAVGAANGSNPIALIIPCHRVIGAN